VAVLDRLLGLAQLPLAGGGGQACPLSPCNETHWPADKKFIALYNQAVVTTDRTKQAAIIQEMQKLEYDTGGYIVWGFSTLLDGYSTKVAGLKQGDKGVLPMNAFGHGYRTIWFADLQRGGGAAPACHPGPRRREGARVSATAVEQPHAAVPPARITGFIIRRIRSASHLFVSIIIFAPRRCRATPAQSGRSAPDRCGSASAPLGGIAPAAVLALAQRLPTATSIRSQRSAGLGGAGQAAPTPSRSSAAVPSAAARRARPPARPAAIGLRPRPGLVTPPRRTAKFEFGSDRSFLLGTTVFTVLPAV
jgi:hypothetical protein